LLRVLAAALDSFASAIAGITESMHSLNPSQRNNLMVPTQLPVPAPPVPPQSVGVQAPAARADTAQDIRVKAAAFERAQPLPAHTDNADEATYPTRIGNYSKGLPHNAFGEVDLPSYATLLTAVTSGQPADFQAINLVVTSLS
jgi:hypothetical protein